MGISDWHSTGSDIFSLVSDVNGSCSRTSVFNPMKVNVLASSKIKRLSSAVVNPPKCNKTRKKPLSPWIQSYHTKQYVIKDIKVFVILLYTYTFPCMFNKVAWEQTQKHVRKWNKSSEVSFNVDMQWNIHDMRWQTFNSFLHIGV